mmetsp:Transcript_37131/g.75332  ORF Transcript_37131/g.75332 Transcript_37131/m.75332 type:complete len:85 (+) Transcript_37131:711-965(+)
MMVTSGGGGEGSAVLSRTVRERQMRCKQRAELEAAKCLGAARRMEQCLPRRYALLYHEQDRERDRRRRLNKSNSSDDDDDGGGG